MTIDATSALAVAFAHVVPTVGTDVALSADDASDTGTANVPAGVYRMALAPAASDFVRLFETAINAALLDGGSAYTAAVFLSRDGTVKVLFSGDVSAVSFSDAAARRLGLPEGILAPVGKRTVLGVRPVWHLALFVSLANYAPQPQQSAGSDINGAGRVYVFGAPVTWWKQSADAKYIPWDPARRAAQGCEGTGMYPGMQYFGSPGDLTTAREWSVLDVLRGAGNGLCGLALGNWQDVLASAGEYYWQAYVAPETLHSLAIKRFDRRVTVWAEAMLAFTHPDDAPTATRA